MISTHFCRHGYLGVSLRSSHSHHLDSESHELEHVTSIPNTAVSHHVDLGEDLWCISVDLVSDFEW